MPTDKFITLSSDKLSERIADLILPVLTKENIWCQRLCQSGKYRGIKVCITAQNASRVAYIIKQARAYIESHKSLKDKQLQKVTDQSVLSDKQQLNELFES
jgi:hypothetical protein